MKRILVRMPNWIGDAVMATPILADLRAAFRDSNITAMCRAPVSDLLLKDPSIDELFSFTKPHNDFLRRSHREVVQTVRASRYDVGLLLTNSFSSAWWLWRANVQRRIGYATSLRALLLTDRICLPQRPLHQIDYYKKLLEPLGIERSQTLPRLFVSDQEMQETRALLVQRGAILGKPLIGIHPGAAYGSAKCWHPERFRELAMQLLQKDPEARLLFFGDLSTMDLIKHICQHLPSRVLNLAGVTTLRELMCLIKECDVLVTNDSGPMHIGAALGTPLVALFGSTDDRRTGPCQQEEAVINKRVHCSPCFKRVCPIDFRCMKEISVEEVVTKTLQQRRLRV